MDTGAAPVRNPRVTVTGLQSSTQGDPEPKSTMARRVEVMNVIATALRSRIRTRLSCLTRSMRSVEGGKMRCVTIELSVAAMAASGW